MEQMSRLSILQFPPNLICKNKLNEILSVEINPLNDKLVMLFMEDPSKEHLIIDLLHKNSRPNIIGRLAGKVKYPELTIAYMGYF